MTSYKLYRRISVVAVLSGWLVIAGCKDKPAATPRPPASTPTTTAPVTARDVPSQTGQAVTGNQVAAPRQMEDVDISGVKFTQEVVDLNGITLTLPEGWVRDESPRASGQFAAAGKVQFRLPKTEDEPEDVTITVHHYPLMKGMDAANVDRWLSQFIQPDGRSTVEVATQADYQLGEVSVTLVDIPGTMRPGAGMGSGPAKENYRMLAAVINHPNGPHFFKLKGPADAVQRSKPSAVAFLKSAKIRN